MPSFSLNSLHTTAALLLSLMILSSCSLFQPKPPQPLGDWAFNGKMAIRNSAGEASSFTVEWLQQGDFFKIELSGPLGAGAMTITGNPYQVTLQQKDNLIHANSLADLALQQTDMALPLDHLQFWVRALPDPIDPYEIELNSEGQAQLIAQAGWTVQILDCFVDAAHAEPLPRKLSFSNLGDSGKLIIREWTQTPQL